MRGLGFDCANTMAGHRTGHVRKRAVHGFLTAVHASWRSLYALAHTYEDIHNDTGDAEAHEIATVLTKYNTVACIYMLSDVLHIVSKLWGSLQGRDIDLDSVPRMVESTTKRLKDMKEIQRAERGLKIIL